MNLYNTNSRELLDRAILCLRQGQNAQGFSLLSAMEENANPSAAFALALCYLRSGELSAAVPHLEHALRLIRALSPVPPNPAENTGTYIKLYRAQVEEVAYLKPMDADFCHLFPKDAERTVLLALIHVYGEMGMKEKARQFSAGLSGKIFEEYIKRLNA